MTGMFILRLVVALPLLLVEVVIALVRRDFDRLEMFWENIRKGGR